jgi:hypothetical protein
LGAGVGVSTGAPLELGLAEAGSWLFGSCAVSGCWLMIDPLGAPDGLFTSEPPLAGMPFGEPGGVGPGMFIPLGVVLLVCASWLHAVAPPAARTSERRSDVWSDMFRLRFNLWMRNRNAIDVPPRSALVGHAAPWTYVCLDALGHTAHVCAHVAFA